MSLEQSKDSDICEVSKLLLSGTNDKAIQRKHMLIDDVVYFISDPDNNATIRLYVPNHLKDLIVRHYHNEAGHMCVPENVWFNKAEILLAKFI